MKKDEIKQALKCCKNQCCSYCPRWCERGCQSRTLSDALDLITEQEKEIDLLQMQMKDVVNHADTFLAEANKFETENKKLKAEIEQRKIDYDILYKKSTKRLKQAKIDVLNELKEQSVHCDQWNCKVVPIEYIDELIKEVEAK